MRLVDLDLNQFDNKQKIVLLCSVKTKDIATFCLKNHGLEVWRYCDIDSEEIKEGYLSFDRVVELEKQHKVVIVVSYRTHVLWLLNRLSNLGIGTTYSIRNLFSKETLRASKLYNSNQTVIEIFDDSFFYEDVFRNPECVYISSVDATVTSRCSLKCKDCSNLMQYYNNPENYDINKLIESINLLLSKIDMLGDLRILGGEPFVNKEFVRLVECFKNNSKIKKISVYSNATIFPDDSILDILKTSGVLLVFSDYGELSSKLNVWKKWCRDNQIGFFVEKTEWWQDCGKLERHDYSFHELLDIYSNCECRSVPTIINNKLYPCQYSANADNLGAMYKNEAEKDYIEINSGLNGNDIFDFLYNRQYLEGCRYCNGRNSKRAKIQAHVQTNKQLKYKIKNKSDYQYETLECSSVLGKSGKSLSVIIPVYNAEEYAKQMILSVLNSTYENMEIIIVDDGSTDNSLSIIREQLEKYQNKRSVLIQNEHHGVVFTRNTGIRHATGEYITFVDADDYIEDRYFENLMNDTDDCDYLRTYYVKCYQDEKSFDEHLGGQKIYYRVFKTFFQEGIFSGDQMRIIWKYMFYNPMYFMENCLYSALYKTDMMKKVYEMIPEEIQYGEDALYTGIYLSLCNKVKLSTNEIGYFYRVRPAEERYDWGESIRNLEKFYNTLEDAFRNHKERKMLLDGAQREYCHFMMSFCRNRFKNNDRYKEFNYPYYGRLASKNVVIYGAGKVGKSYYKSAIAEGECRVVAWVDKNAEEIQKKEMLPVSNTDILPTVDFDILIIAVANRWQRDVIEKELEEIGIEKSRMEWFPTKEVAI